MVATATTTTEYHLRQGDVESGDVGSISSCSSTSTNSINSNSNSKDNDNTNSSKSDCKRKKKLPIIRNICCSKIPAHASQRVTIPTPREAVVSRNSGSDDDSVATTTIRVKPQILSDVIDDDLWSRFNKSLNNTFLPDNQESSSRKFLLYLLAGITFITGIGLFTWKVLPPAWHHSIFLVLQIILVLGILGYQFHHDGMQHKQVKQLVKQWKPTFEAAGCSINYVIPPPSSNPMMCCCGCASCREAYLYFGGLDGNKNNSKQDTTADTVTTTTACDDELSSSIADPRPLMEPPAVPVELP